MTESSSLACGDQTSLMNSLPGMAYRCLMDANWTMLEISPQAEQLTGYKPEEFINNACISFGDMIVEEDRALVERGVRAAIDQKTHYYLEYRIKTRDGEVRHVWEHGGGVYSESGEFIELSGYVCNTTPKVQELDRQRGAREAVVELARDQHLARGDVEVFARHAVKTCCDVLQVSSASVWLFSSVKNQWEMLVYYHAERDHYDSGFVVKAQDCPAYFDWVSRERVIDAYDAQADSRTQEFNKSFLIPVDVKSVLHCAIRQGGRVVGVVCLEQTKKRRRWLDHEVTLVGDVADQMAHVVSNREIRQAENRLLEEQASSDAKSHFLSVMSHEIRTPLNGVLGVADLLSMTQLDFKQQEYVSLIEESGKLLLKIIGDILDFTKINSGELGVQFQPTDVVGLSRDCMTLVSSEAESKSINLDLIVSPEVPSLCEVDALRLQQVLLNLLTNSIKFTHQGEVLLKVGVSRRAQDTYLSLAVIDSGVGIADDLAQKIFEPFSQDRMLNVEESIKGAGLGLPICRGLVGLMGGTIELQSEVGKGSVFRVLLPLRAVEPVSKIDVTNDDKVDFSDLKVLVAEDNIVNQKVVSGMLKLYSIEAELCADGSQAVERVNTAAEPYDLILMDCEMPVMDGFEAVETIRQMPPPKCATFIAALTAHALREYKERAEKVGMDDYLTKPLKREVLGDLLRRISASL